MASKLFTINITDAQKAIIVAAISAGGAAAYRIIETSVTAGRMPTGPEWVIVLKAFGLGVFGYIGKNFFSNSSGNFAGKEIRK
jgi:hypothetical protein